MADIIMKYDIMRNSPNKTDPEAYKQMERDFGLAPPLPPPPQNASAGAVGRPPKKNRDELDRLNIELKKTRLASLKQGMSLSAKRQERVQAALRKAENRQILKDAEKQAAPVIERELRKQKEQKQFFRDIEQEAYRVTDVYTVEQKRKAEKRQTKIEKAQDRARTKAEREATPQYQAHKARAEKYISKEANLARLTPTIQKDIEAEARRLAGVEKSRQLYQKSQEGVGRGKYARGASIEQIQKKLQKQFLEGRRESFQKPKFTSLDTQQAYAERAAMYQRKLMQKVPTYREFQKVGKGVAGLIGAFGLSTQGGYKAARRPVGRPRKTYLHGMPIQQWKQLQSQRGQVMQLAQMQQEQDLVKRGYSPQQIENIRLQRMAQERMNPSRQPASMEEYVQQNTVSPNTMMMLERINQIHQKGQVDNARMQRIVRERRMIQDATDLMKAPNMFGPQASTFNILDTSNTILQADNVFKENPDNNILKPRGTSILRTSDSGNSLNWL